ncbi:MAG: phytanoyl-CoA dioxygenase family protein [Bacteroidetes bacterium]|nr:phytanoyl-CoA dioxygenase family protein [Bacteroidota bacterium]
MSKHIPRDLSVFHQLVSDIFKWPATPEEWQRYRLTEEQLKFFADNGYLSNVRLLEEWQVDQLNDELAELIDPEHPDNSLFHQFFSNSSTDPGSVLFHALGAWRIRPGFHDVLWNPAFAMAASQLLNDQNVRFWHDQLFCKPARHGGVVAWHQDYSYWTRTTPMQHLTCWVGLDDATTENGCMYYVPNSHRWGLLEKPNLTGDMEGLLSVLTEEQKANFHPIPIELKKGCCSFHHPLLVHGSYENRSDRPRRAFVLNVFADGTISGSDEPLMPGTPVISKGEKVGGQFFPLIIDRKLIDQ